jgi:hypothetical protein
MHSLRNGSQNVIASDVTVTRRYRFAKPRKAIATPTTAPVQTANVSRRSRIQGAEAHNPSMINASSQNTTP